MNTNNKDEANGYMSYKHIYFSLDGRISRGEYWLYAVIPLAFIFLFEIWIFKDFIEEIIGIFTSFIDTNIVYQYIYVIPFLVTLILLILSLAITVKRLHDINKSAWLLIILLVPIVGLLYLMIVTLCHGGNNYANRFGGPSDNTRMNNLYRLNIRALDKVIQSSAFKGMFVLCAASILTMLLIDIFRFIDFNPMYFFDRQIADFSYIYQSLPTVVDVVSIAVVCLFGVNYIKRNAIRNLTVVLLIVLVFISISVFINSGEDIIGACSMMITVFLAMIVIAYTFCVAGFKESRSNVYVLSLVVTSYGLLTLLNSLYSILHGNSVFSLLEPLILFELGMFLKCVDKNMNADNSDVIISSKILR
jgi:uncharacterized membrane protein YhaH (DUF805 family)